MNNYPPYDPNDPHSQPTTAGSYPQFPPLGQPSSPQWGQQAPPPPQYPPQYSQPGQFGPPQQPVPDKLPWFNVKARKEYFQRHPEAKKKQTLIGCGSLIGVLLLCALCSAIGNASNPTKQTATASQPSPVQATPTPHHVILATMLALTPQVTSTPTPTPEPTQAPVVQQPYQQPVQQQPVQQPPPQQAPAPVDGNKNCSDFATQEQAQNYFNSLGGSPSNDVDGLDRDHDGIACESLPK